MGFTTGFIGGVTLTTSLFYLSLSLHQRNRLYQSTLLRQQSKLLLNITDPQPPEPAQTLRHTTPGLGERLKHRWNAELEAAVKKVQGVRWDRLVDETEERVAGLWTKGADAVEKRVATDSTRA